ncbi:Hint domain-containing protein [Paracoccaceae bacterium Fryx2]|nr:Hint domain-containing protein [Paracoccaceae bacterium Fryx2]
MTATSGNDIIRGTTGADSLSGLDGDDTLVGDSGPDTLDGGNGNDLIEGGSGDDRLLGGAGNDCLDTGAGSDTVFAGDGNDTIFGGGGGKVGNLLYGEGGNDLIYNGTDNDTVYGGEGNDTIFADQGSDYLDGGGGDDLFIVETGFVAFGNDTIIGGETGERAGDMLEFSRMSSGLTVNMTGAEAGTASDGFSKLAFSQIEKLTLGSGADTVFGGAGNDWIDTGAGDDRVFAGAGADSIALGDGNDTLEMRSPDRLADTIDGGAGNDRISLAGGGSNDVVFGGAGNDTLTTAYDLSGGSDTLYGGDGRDVFVAGADDSVVGGEGGDDFDTIDLTTIPVAATVLLSGTGAGTITYGTYRLNFTEMEAITGTAFADTIKGGADGGGMTYDTGAGNDVVHGGSGSDRIDAGSGDDSVDGGAGADTISGGAGNDNLLGGDGNDLLRGGDGADHLFGNAGSDTLDGGAGADVLSGGAGADLFLVDAGGDRITDFDATSGSGNADESDNDVVDLSAFYNRETLAAWNAANPGRAFANPMGWLRADQADGVLRAAGGLTLYSPDGLPVTGADLNAENTRVICFARGTRILSRQGETGIETLQPGDAVLTRDNGFQPVRWVGHRALSGDDLAAAPQLRPVRIAKGAMGPSLPARDLVVSPQHRVLVCSAIAKRMLGAAEVLVAAKHLVGMPGITVDDGPAGVEYWHILLARHEVVFAEGTPSETLYTGPEALRSLGPQARKEIFSLFPELAGFGHDHLPEPARPFVRGGPGRRLARHHATNGKPLVMAPSA